MISFLKKYKEAVVSAFTLALALITDHLLEFEGQAYVFLSLYFISYLSVGGPVWAKAFRSIRKGTIFSEFLLMGIATVGAFALGEYAEGVAVMLFYMIGEYAQHGAVHKARNSIKKLIDQQPDVVSVERDGRVETVHPSEVEVGEIIRVRPGEKVPLDGILVSNQASFNTAALTGESKPMTRRSEEEVWAGSITQDRPAHVRVKSRFQDSRLSNILKLVQEAAQRKAPTQRFMTKFAKVYTPAVVWLAVGLTFVPYLFVDPYIFEDWFYRALIFLVVSCPCGLVISIPLGYFGGIGAASQNGILFKGSDYLDQLRKMKTLFMDKTGTLTEGVFEVQEVIRHNGLGSEALIRYAASMEQHSTHPVGKAIMNFRNGESLLDIDELQEISGQGLKGKVGDKEILVGNQKLLKEHNVTIEEGDYNAPYTYVHVAVEGEHAGTILISDRIKEDASQAIKNLRSQGVEELIMLSGDNQEVVTHVAQQIGLNKAYGNLMPDEKYQMVEKALRKNQVVGFVGDGINDAPVITLSDVGLAMGGIGSDATIETADVVIQTDQPSKIATAVDIARFTHRVVWQNIAFALSIKVLVMMMAAYGLATMWEAIFADVGVALIAIGNAIRIQNKYSGTTLKDFLFASEGTEDKESNSEPQTCCESC